MDSEPSGRGLYIGSHSGVAEALSRFVTHVDVCSIGPSLWRDGMRQTAATVENLSVTGEYDELLDALAEPLSGSYSVIVVGCLARCRPTLDASRIDGGLGISTEMIDHLVSPELRTVVFYEPRIRHDDVKLGKKCMTKFARYVLSRTDGTLGVHAVYAGPSITRDSSRVPLIVEHLLTKKCEPGAYGYTTLAREFGTLRERANICRRPVPDEVRSVVEGAGSRIDRVGISRDGVEVISTEASGTSAIDRCRALRDALRGTGYTPVITQDTLESMQWHVESAHLELATVQRQLDALDEPAELVGAVDYAIDADSDTARVEIASYAPDGSCRIVLVPDEFGGALAPCVCAAGPQLAGVRFVAQLKQWHERFGATVLFAGSAMEFDVARPPANLQTARQLAYQHLGTAHNLERIPSELAYARWLQQSPRWSFWWD